MPITEEQMREAEAPFYVVGDCQTGKRKGLPKKEKPSQIVGFSENDPEGVGGGFFPNFPTAYFENGGWVLVKDLMKHFTIVDQPNVTSDPLGNQTLPSKRALSK